MPRLWSQRVDLCAPNTEWSREGKTVPQNRALLYAGYVEVGHVW